MDSVLNIVGMVCCWLVYGIVALEVIAFGCRVYVKAFPRRVSREPIAITLVRKSRGHVAGLFHDIKAVKAHVVNKEG